MLQVLTGRFFEGNQKLNEAGVEAVLFSNWSCYGSIRTLIGEIKKSHYGESTVSTYIFYYLNRYEPASDKDPMVFAHSDEAVEQFRTLCCVWFRSIFHPSKSFVESLVGPKTRYLDRYLDTCNDATQDDRLSFGEFLDSILSLPREKYLRVISCARAFCDSIEIINNNFDIAYSMLVYMLETLSKATDNAYTPVWEDVEEGQRMKIDGLCELIDSGAAAGIRAVLTNAQHLKLSKRFVEFVLDNVKDSFFAVEATTRTFAIRKSDLPRLLKNVYSARSGYVHDLKEALADIRYLGFDPNSDTIRSRHDVHLTYSGLVRLARHVILTFIERAPKVSEESVAWRCQLPGIVMGELAPDYWIHQTEGFGQAHAKHKFSGFTAYFLDLLTKPTATMTPLRPLIDIVQQLLPIAKSANKASLVGMFWIYNALIVEDLAVPDWNQTVVSILDADDACRIEYLAVSTLIHCQFLQNAESCEHAYRDYVLHRNKSSSVHLPSVLEIAVICRIANLYLEQVDLPNYSRLVTEAIADLPGVVAKQTLLTQVRDGHSAVDIRSLLGQPARESSPNILNGVLLPNHSD